MKTQIRFTSRYCEQRLSQLCILVGCYADPWERWSGTRSISEGLRGPSVIFRSRLLQRGCLSPQRARFSSSQPTWMAWLLALVALRLAYVTETQASSNLRHDPVRLPGLFPGESQFPGGPEKTRGLLRLHTSAAALQAPGEDGGARFARTCSRIDTEACCCHCCSEPGALVTALRERTARRACVNSSWSLGSNVGQWHAEVIKPHHIPTGILPRCICLQDLCEDTPS